MLVPAPAAYPPAIPGDKMPLPLQQLIAFYQKPHSDSGRPRSNMVVCDARMTAISGSGAVVRQGFIAAEMKRCRSPLRPWQRRGRVVFGNDVLVAPIGQLSVASPLQ
jgi:hypothetical protein